jgi:pimeloyl-ACP methyl ester carboxylesterase
MTDCVETTVEVGGVGVVVLEGGAGRPLLMLHDELGFPGWMRWNRELAQTRRIVAPLQPGFGRTPKVDWFRTYRDLASFYSRMVREQGLGPIDVIGFSAGGFVAAEMAAACPNLIGKLVLVAPLGVRPSEGEIFDFLAVTMRTHVAMTAADHDSEEFKEIYGGGMSAEQFELFEAARGETTRLGWEPYMFDPSLPQRLEGVGGLETLVIWGDEDQIVPRGCVDVYERAIPKARVEVIAGAGHRPEIEDADKFIKLVSDFLGDEPTA